MTNARKLLLLLVVLTVGAVFLSGVNAAEEWDYGADAEPLTRGPVHEAYAQPVTLDVEDRFVVSQKPPAPIQEIPPEEKPSGDNVVWIPGYWHYDDDASDFVWISGCWRAVPPGKSWIPGYWQETANGYEWVMGFWKDSGVGSIVYLPAPPETLETGPSSVAPSADSIWVQGSWVWQPGTFWRRGSYAWRPGFWVTPRPDWVWVPAHYVYTPHGHVFVEGYWDYTLPERGVVFLPVRFSSGVYLQAGFSFSPSLVIGADLIFSDLFFSPRRRHYYFGDYYAVRYSSLDFYPWFAFRHRVMIHDHLFAHASWRHRDEPNWSRQRRDEFENRRQHEETRPPRTYRQRNQLERPGPDSRGQGRPSIRPIHEFARDQDSSRKFEKLDQRQREEIGRRGRVVESYRQGRSKWENPAAKGPERGSRPADVERKPGPERGSRPADVERKPGPERGSRPADVERKPGPERGSRPTDVERKPGPERGSRPADVERKPGPERGSRPADVERKPRPRVGDSSGRGDQPGTEHRGDQPPVESRTSDAPVRERPSRTVPVPGDATPTPVRERPSRTVPVPVPGDVTPTPVRERPSRTVPVEPSAVQPEPSTRLSGASRPSVDETLPGYSESRAKFLPARTVSGSGIDRSQARPQTVRIPESPIGNGSRSGNAQVKPPEMPQYQAPARSGPAAGSRSGGSRSDGGRRKMQSRP